MTGAHCLKCNATLPCDDRKPCRCGSADRMYCRHCIRKCLKDGSSFQCRSVSRYKSGAGE